MDGTMKLPTVASVSFEFYKSFTKVTDGDNSHLERLWGDKIHVIPLFYIIRSP